MAPTATTDQTFSFEIVSCLLASLLSSGVTVGAQHFALMAKMDGSTTKSGYEHRFRAVKARAKEINEQIAKGEINVDVTPVKSKPKNGGGKSATPASSKRSEISFSVEINLTHMLIDKTERAEEPSAAESENASCARDEDDEETKTPFKTPTKKPKVKQEAKSEEGDYLT
ncbi:uncharacterized protein RCC_03136 [Ramularia collo-cygni]|uniref:Uncharacterized protein n=1 Tax=Ramularia collo-cygni TaxID=112498 RepID=A0A2D3UN62_9PEZI|nr:uncharacterized protein RCC_03136 [Ramularia collo-cygni]CZT17302.1 uncharacterized protein RCC_03136 [Ramularia collo-cygni]